MAKQVKFTKRPTNKSLPVTTQQDIALLDFLLRPVFIHQPTYSLHGRLLLYAKRVVLSTTRDQIRKYWHLIQKD